MSDIVQRAEKALNGREMAVQLRTAYFQTAASARHNCTDSVAWDRAAQVANEFLHGLIEEVETLRGVIDGLSGGAEQAKAWATWFAAERDWIKENYVDDLAATYRWQIDAKAKIERVRALADAQFAWEIRRALDDES